jgi:hypothetical protein
MEIFHVMKSSTNIHLMDLSRPPKDLHCMSTPTINNPCLNKSGVEQKMQNAKIYNDDDDKSIRPQWFNIIMKGSMLLLQSIQFNAGMVVCPSLNSSNFSSSASSISYIALSS